MLSEEKSCIHIFITKELFYIFIVVQKVHICERTLECYTSISKYVTLVSRRLKNDNILKVFWNISMKINMYRKYSHINLKALSNITVEK